MGSPQRWPICAPIPRTALPPPNKSRRSPPNAALDDDDDDPPPPPERKARVSKSGSKRRSKSGGRSRIGRLFYWTAVLGLWAAIAIVGVVIWVGAHLPAIQSLEIPKRPPTIQIVGLDGSVLASPRRNGRQQCRAEGPAALLAESLHRHRRPPLLFAFRRRSRRHRARRGDQRAASRGLAGRLDPDAAARQEPVPDAGAHLPAQAAGGRARAVAGAQAFQERDSRALSQPRLFRLGRLWRGGCRAKIFRQVGEIGDRRGSRDAGRPRQVAVAAGAKPQSRGRRAARANRARGDGGCQVHHRCAGAGFDRPSLLQCEGRPAPAP